MLTILTIKAEKVEVDNVVGVPDSEGQLRVFRSFPLYDDLLDLPLVKVSALSSTPTWVAATSEEFAIVEAVGNAKVQELQRLKANLEMEREQLISKREQLVSQLYNMDKELAAEKAARKRLVDSMENLEAFKDKLLEQQGSFRDSNVFKRIWIAITRKL